MNSSQNHKDSITAQLQVPPSTAGQTVYLSYLRNSGAESTENTTWNGISFKQNRDGTPLQVSDDEHTVQVDANGMANLCYKTQKL